MKGIQILTEKNKKEVKEHGSYTFIRRSNLHGSYPDRWNMSSMTSVILSQKAKGYSATVMLYMPDI